MRGLLARLTKEKGSAAVDSAYSVYTAHWGSVPEQDVVKKTVADIESDFLFLVPTQIALQLHANNARSAPICPVKRRKQHTCTSKIPQMKRTEYFHTAD